MKIKLKYIPTLILTLMTAFAGLALLAPYAAALNPDSADAWVEVNDSCGFDSDFSYTYTFSAVNGTADDTDNIVSDPRPTITLNCNSISGFVVKAVGFSPDATHATGDDGNTDMYSSTTTAIIPTGAGTTTGTIPTSTASFWGMRIQASVTQPSSGASATVASAYALAAHNYAAVPTTATTVVTYPGSTAMTVEGTMRPDYGFYVSQSQPAGTYTGKVKYTVIPN